MLVKILADQRDEGSFHKGWFSSVKRLHYTFHPSQTNICGTRTNFTRARTTFSEGPSRTFFFGTRAIFIRAVPKIFCSVNGALVGMAKITFSQKVTKTQVPPAPPPPPPRVEIAHAIQYLSYQTKGDKVMSLDYT